MNTDKNGEKLGIHFSHGLVLTVADMWGYLLQPIQPLLGLVDECGDIRLCCASIPPIHRYVRAGPRSLFSCRLRLFPPAPPTDSGEFTTSFHIVPLKRSVNCLLTFFREHPHLLG